MPVANGITASGVMMSDVPTEEVPNPPGGSLIIGKVYEFGPAGLTFSPAIDLTFYFNSLPDRIQKKDLYIAAGCKYENNLPVVNRDSDWNWCGAGYYGLHPDT